MTVPVLGAMALVLAHFPNGRVRVPPLRGAEPARREHGAAHASLHPACRGGVRWDAPAVRLVEPPQQQRRQR